VTQPQQIKQSRLSGRRSMASTERCERVPTELGVSKYLHERISNALANVSHDDGIARRL